MFNRKKLNAMSTAILISFVIPCAITLYLTIMLIKERDSFFSNKPKYNSQKRNDGKERKRSSNDSNTPWDIWGGTMGV